MVREPGGLSWYCDGVQAGWPWFDSQQGQGIFFFSSVQTGSGVLGSTQPPVQLVLWAVSPGVKWPGCEVDHSTPSSAKAKNGGAVPPLLTCLHDVVLN